MPGKKLDQFGYNHSQWLEEGAGKQLKSKAYELHFLQGVHVMYCLESTPGNMAYLKNKGRILWGKSAYGCSGVPSIIPS